MTPIQKLNCITDVSKKIRDEIKEFWKGVNVDSRKLVLDGEQITMIYEFITIKAEILNLFAHI